MNSCRLIVSVSVGTLFAVVASCRASIPTAGDYGMTPRQVKKTRSWAYIPRRNPRVSVRKTASNGYEIELSGFETVAAEQRERDWCWAACIEMVTRYNGNPVDQEDVVERIKGKTRDRGDDAGSVLDTMRGLWGAGRTTSVSPGSSNWMFADLAFDSPLIVGLEPEEGSDIGHAVVLTGMEFSFGPRGEVIVHTVSVYDPIDADELKLDGPELRDQIDFVVHFRDYRRFW